MFKVNVKHNAPSVEQAYARTSPVLLKNIQDATRLAGNHLIEALEMGDNSSGEWQGSFFRSPAGAIFEAHSTDDTQAYQEYGVRPHKIHPKRAKALSFFWNKRQGRHFFAYVNHPGRTAKPFVERMGRFAERAMLPEFERAVQDAIE